MCTSDQPVRVEGRQEEGAIYLLILSSLLVLPGDANFCGHTQRWSEWSPFCSLPSHAHPRHTHVTAQLRLG